MTGGWEIATAIGTITAAAATTGLAWSTRRLAREAGAETRANWQPVLVPQDPDAGGVGGGWSPALSSSGNTDGTVDLTVNVRNIGRGPALHITASLARDFDEGWEQRGSIARGHAFREEVGPDGWTTISWRAFSPPEAAVLSEWAWAPRNGVITYWDVSGVRYETFICVGFGKGGGPDGRIVLLPGGRYVGSARMPNARARLKLRVAFARIQVRVKSRRLWRRLRGRDPLTGQPR